MKNKKTRNRMLRLIGVFLVLFMTGLLAFAQEKDELLLHDFESIREMYTMYSSEGRFGRLSLNQDEKFITSGEASAKLEVVGNWRQDNGTTMPVLTTLLDIEEDYACQDFTKVKELTFDLFNETGKEQKIYISLTFEDDTDTLTSEDWEVVLEQGLNHVSYELDGSILSWKYDLSRTKAINIKFDKLEDVREEDPLVFYMDNMKLHFGVFAWEPAEIVQEENEICSFDDQIHISMVESGSIGPAAAYAPQLFYNQDLRYCKDYKGTSIKVVMPAADEVLNAWPMMKLNVKLFENYNMTEMALENKDLVFDVYNTGGPTSMVLYCQGNDGIEPLSYATPVTYDIGWTEIRIPLMKLYETVAEGNKDAQEGEKVARLSDPGVMTSFYFAWDTFAGEPKVLYMDNFRFE